MSDTDIGELGPLLDFYKENGPSLAARGLVPPQGNTNGLAGYLAMLVGNRTPHEVCHQPLPAERAAWKQILADFQAEAGQGMTVAEVLTAIRSPRWRWQA